MKKIIVLFLFLISVSSIYSLVPFFFGWPPSSLNSLTPNNLGIMDEANSLSNKEKLFGFTSSNYLSFCINYDPFLSNFYIISPLTIPYGFDFGLMYRVGLKHKDEFSFRASINYPSTNLAYSFYIPVTFDFGYKKEIYTKGVFSSAYKINLGQTLGPGLIIFNPIIQSSFIIKNSFIFSFNAKKFNFSLIPSYQFAANILLPLAMDVNAISSYLKNFRVFLLHPLNVRGYFLQKIKAFIIFTRWTSLLIVI
ncbi:MAG TPA: hypothetical protein PK771_06675 [Spirochaetota bacterium]|nr:hypothetical protein [Spirochaetota bacterium]